MRNRSAEVRQCAAIRLYNHAEIAEIMAIGQDESGAAYLHNYASRVRQAADELARTPEAQPWWRRLHRWLFLMVLLLLGCSQEVTAPSIGGASRCPRLEVGRVVHFSVGNGKTYALEIAQCVYEVTARPDASLIDSDSLAVTLIYPRNWLLEATRGK